MAQNLISKHYEELLVKKVRSKGRNCYSIEDVLANLDVLAKKSVKYGDEETAWLSISTKKMIAKAIDPNCRVEVPVNEIVRYKNTLGVTAYFYWSDCPTYAGRGFARKNLEDLVTGPQNARKVETEFEALVMGAAISRAMTDAGIGMEFYSDDLDVLYAEVEEQDANAILDRNHEEALKSIPEVPSLAEKKTRKAKVKEKEPENTPEDFSFLNVPAVEPVAATIEKTIPEATIPKATEIATEGVLGSSSASSLDEAKMVIADAGKFKGQPLGIIYAARPLSLIWLYNNSETCKEAAKIIIDSDENLKAKI